MNVENNLKELGLKPSEIRVYLALLLLGESKVNEIAKQSGTIRTSTYDVLKSLEEKGFISHVVKSNIKYFQAVSAKSIQQKFEEQLTTFSNLVPKLESLRKQRVNKHDVAVFEGKEGIKSILNSILKNKRDHKIVGNASVFVDLINYYLPNYISQRMKNKIHAKVLREKTKETRSYAKKDKQEFRQTKLSSELNEINAEMFIYDNKIVLLSLLKEDLKGIVIENNEIMKLLDVLFENYFNSL